MQKKITGLRLFFVTLLGSFAATIPYVLADAPFFTDDPVFSPGWEIKAGITTERNCGGSVLTEVLDWNYAVVSNVRLNLTTYTKHIWPSGRHHKFGYGDTEFKIKWRFLDESSKGAHPAFGIAPKVFIPTAESSRGLSDGVWRFQFPLQFGKMIGHWYYFGEAGYQWAFDRVASDSVFGGMGTVYLLTEKLTLGTELFGSVPTDNRSNWQLLTTLGAIYTFSSHWQLKASISHTLRDTARGGPKPASVFYGVWNF